MLSWHSSNVNKTMQHCPKLLLGRQIRQVTLGTKWSAVDRGKCINPEQTRNQTSCNEDDDDEQGSGSGQKPKTDNPKSLRFSWPFSKEQPARDAACAGDSGRTTTLMQSLEDLGASCSHIESDSESSWSSNDAEWQSDQKALLYEWKPVANDEARETAARVLLAYFKSRPNNAHRPTILPGRLISQGSLRTKGTRLKESDG